MLSLTYPHCGHQLRILEKYAGQTGACNKCRGKISVLPMAQPTPQARPPQQPAALWNSLTVTGVHEHSGVWNGVRTTVSGRQVEGCINATALFGQDLDMAR